MTSDGNHIPDRWAYPDSPPTGGWPLPPPPPAEPPRPRPRWVIPLAVVAVLVAVAASAAIISSRTGILDRAGQGPAPPACPEKTDGEDRFALRDPRRPRYVGCSIVVLDGDELVGTNPEDLEVAWRVDCPYADWASVLPSRHDHIEVAVCDRDYVGVDGRTGEVLWSRPVEWATHRVRVTSSVLVLQADDVGITVIDLIGGTDRFEIYERRSANTAADDAHVYTATEDGVTAYDMNTGSAVWVTDGGTSGLIATGTWVFARTNQHIVWRLEAATGKKAGTSGEYHPVELGWSDFVHTSDEVVVLQSTRDRREVSVYDAKTLDRLWVVPGGSGGAATGGDGAVAVALDRRIEVYDERSGKELHHIVNAGEPAIAEGRLYYIAIDPGEPWTTLRMIDLT